MIVIIYWNANLIELFIRCSKIQFCFSHEVQTNLPRAQNYWTKKKETGIIKYSNCGFDTELCTTPLEKLDPFAYFLET